MTSGLLSPVVIIGTAHWQLYGVTQQIVTTYKMNSANPKIKLVAIDLDGTLLTSERKIHPEAKKAISFAVESGITVCLASGRALNTIEPYASDLNLTGPFVSCNGAYVLGLDRKEIHHRTLPDDVRDLVFNYARERSVHTNVYVGTDVYFSSDGDWADLYRQRTGLMEQGIEPFDSLSRYRPTKLLFIDSPQAVMEHKERLSVDLDPEKTTIALSEAEYIEFLPPKINKAEGLKAVANVLNIDRLESAAIGDYHNDLEMVEWAGLGGAVATAVEEVRQVADLVVASNDDGGVAEFIYTVIERNR